MFHKLDKTLLSELSENQCVFIQVLSVNMHCELFPFCVSLQVCHWVFQKHSGKMF